MTQDEIIRMAKESGAVERYFGNQLHGIAFHKKEWLERFAALVAAHWQKIHQQEMSMMSELCADRILEEREKQADTFIGFDAALKEAMTIEAAVLAEREACAKVCEEIEQDRWNLYKGRPPYTGSESGRADPHEQGVSMGAGECAAAIRARSEK